jgi:hypothetical protein
MELIIGISERLFTVDTGLFGKGAAFAMVENSSVAVLRERLRYPLGWGFRGRVPHWMNLLTVNQWEIAAAAVLGSALLALGLWLIFHKRPTAEELERARRQFLAHSGRLVDGMLLDVCEVDCPAQSKKETDRTLTMLLFSYRIGGVDYESSQDITDMSGVIDAAQVRAGFPCSARYQPGNPQNSIVVAEEWSGLRAGLPAQHEYEDPEPADLSHLRPGRG